MADISVEKKQGVNLTWLWALAAVAAIAALMVWLFANQPDSTAVVTNTAADSVTAADSASVQSVSLATIAAAPDTYLGQEVRLEDVTVAALLGNRGFWAEVPGANPFLVILGPETGDVSWLAAGATPTVSGVVEAVTPEEVNIWVQTMAIAETAAAEAGFATHYLRVSAVEQ